MRDELDKLLLIDLIESNFRMKMRSQLANLDLNLGANHEKFA
jgi:hypothetical protein